MATMTLRVGTIKGVRPTLNCDKEVYVLHVPVKFLEEARQLNLDDATLVLVEKLASASSMDEQLQSLKKLMKMVTIHSGSRDMKDAAIDVDFIARLMTTLYVEASPKNPLKCALTRLLLSFPEERHDSVASHLASVLNKLLCPNLNLAEMNSVIVAVNCCFDNFTIGIKAVVHESPTKKMELCQLIHITLRTVLALLQKCQEQIRNLIHDEVKFKGSPLQNNMMVNVIDLFEPQCKILDSSENIRHKESCDKQRFPTIFVLNSLQELVRGIMCFPELPMDTHTNCGIAFVHLTLILRKYGQELNMEINELELPWKIDISTDSSQLSLCTGLLTALTAKELGDHLVIVDRPVIHYIFDQLNSINQRTTANSAMVLAVSRTLLLLSRSARSLEDVSTIESFLPHLLQFVLIHLEHYMDSVRHSATGILQNLVELGSKQQQKCEARKRILSTILEAVKVMPLHRKSKVIGLEILASVMGCQLLIDHIPDLVPNLLSSLADATISTHVTSAIERLMLKHISECPESTWRKMWIEPIKEMLPQASPSLCGPLQDLLAATVKHNPGLITYILDLPTCSGNSKLQLCTFLSCIRLSRKQGALDNESVFVHSPNLWKGILDMRVLEGAMYHHDVELRMSALSLLTESHRSTEVFTMSELHLIKTFLVYNINTEIPSSRQQMLSLMKKVLTRMKNSSLAVHRKMGPKKPKDVNDYGENVLKFYNTFLLWLLDFCFSNLFPGANFGRRVSSLKILSLCYEIISFNSDQPVWTPSPPDVWTLNNCSILLECLKDTYEDNKTMAVNLLVAFPAEALSLNDPSNVRSLVEVCLSLSSSHRPPDCITAAYVLRVLIAFKQTDAAFEAILKNKEPCKVNNTLYLAILVLFNRLKAELYQARKSLLIAASSGPMGIAEDCCWRDLMSELVRKDHLEQRTDCIVSETPILNVTAQMVLLCSWQKQVLAIGAHLATLLSETKHRGAFEQAYVGFCALCSRLWRHPSARLHILPQQWLQQIMGAITVGKDESNDVVSIIEARSHALNILRSLFRNSSLGELVVPYVARGIIERNSATLLYTTLMTRIFGVSRSKETLNIRNRMTGRIFFQRYPSLYDFLLEELKEAVAAMEECNDVLRPALFPVLLLLGRLYPSSLEGTDSNLQLGVYVPYVRRCALSSVLKIRELAARALVPLLAPNQYSSILQEIISTLSHQEYMLNILIEVASTPEIQKEITEEIENWITNLNWMIISPDVCSMTAQVYLHVLTVVSMNLLPTLNPNMWEEICVILRSDLLIEKDLPSSRLVGRRIFCHRTAQLVLYHSLVTCTKTLPPPKFLADIEGLVTQLICHKEYEVAIVALKFLEVLVSQGNDLSEDAEDYTLPIDPEFCIRVHQWNRTHNGVLGEYFRTCSGVGEILLNKVLGPDPYVFQECYQRTFRVLSYCPHIPLLLGRGQEVLKSFLEKCQMECETIVLDLCKLWTTVMTLLDDDSEYVRELVSELSLRLNCTKLPVMSQRARELLLDYFYEMMIQKDALMCAVSLVIWCLGTSDFDYMEELAEDRVFDKGEMNIFSETAILIDLVCGYLKKLLCNDGEAKVLNTKLCRSVKMWISEMCWPDADSEEISNECDTLADFVQRAKQNKTLPSSASHALLENKKYSFLMILN
ncbi:hypothetical protein C0J52_03298 [Blattella germanica]|nr:hypothetical protein C0J52_03298 [Blattella germanica]